MFFLTDVLDGVVVIIITIKRKVCGSNLDVYVFLLSIKLTKNFLKKLCQNWNIQPFMTILGKTASKSFYAANSKSIITCLSLSI